MSKANGHGKPLRIAALIRVSTEKQERKGESLRTQGNQIEQATAALGAKIVRRYAGQEHATEGYERQLLDRLLADAANPDRPFDAVMVADPTRWSRDNVKSEQGLELLKDAGVRFFVLTTEHDLYDPQARLFLGLSSTIGAFHARVQKQKSLLNRIARAKASNAPTCGRLPFGRVWDADRKEWSVDPDKKAMIEDVAARYLAGESLPKLAREYGVNHANLCKILRERCGDAWEQEFRADDLNIAETVRVAVPRLLDESTIRAVLRCLEKNRTYGHKPPRSAYDFLLRGCIFCAGCGYSLMGQTNPNGRHYYRHARHEWGRECPFKEPRPWVRAERIEEAVVADLFNMFGNPAAIERSVRAAVPDCDKALRRRARVEEELAKLAQARDRVLALVIEDHLTESQAAKKLGELKGREGVLRDELGRLNAALADVPDPADVRRYVERFGESVVVFDDGGNQYAGGNDVQSFLLMSRQERRALVESVFGAHLPDGTPGGVYIKPAGGQRFRRKQFTYELRGRLAWRGVPRALD